MALLSQRQLGVSLIATASMTLIPAATASAALMPAPASVTSTGKALSFEQVAGPMINHPVARHEAILHYTNAIRASHGLRPVAHNRELDRIAQDWANRMRDENNLYHRPQHWNAYPAHIPAGGENILQAWDDYSSYQLVKLWYESPGHRKILLDPKAKTLGLGVATQPNGRLYAVQDFGR